MSVCVLHGLTVFPFFCFPLKYSPNNASAIVFFPVLFAIFLFLCMYSCNWVAVSHSIVFVLCKGGSANNLFLQTSNSRYGVKLCQIFCLFVSLVKCQSTQGFSKHIVLGTQFKRYFFALVFFCFH